MNNLREKYKNKDTLVLQEGMIQSSMNSSQKDISRVKNIKFIALEEFYQGNHCRSIYILEKLSKIVPTDEEIIGLIARNYSEQDMIDEAIKTIEQGLKTIGRTKYLLFELALLQKANPFMIDELKQTIQELIKCDQNDVDILMLKASHLLDEEKTNEAISIYKQIYSLDKNNHVSLRNLALCFKKEGKYAEAIQFAQQSLSVCKEDSLAEAIKANSLIASDLDHQSVETARKTISTIALNIQQKTPNKSSLRLRKSHSQLIEEIQMSHHSSQIE